jgi:RNA polymerase sigma factor CnrH
MLCHRMNDESKPAETDGALAARALRGDDASFAGLMSRHKGWAYQFIRRYVGNETDAYDVLQETFFAAWLALSRYQGDRPFEFWLRRIALNKCRDRSRREVVRRLINSPWSGDEMPDVVDTAPGPQAALEGEQELTMLASQVRKLPRSLKEPLLLTAVEGLSHDEAGKLLGLSAKAVETRVYRARSRLAQLMERKSQISD